MEWICHGQDPLFRARGQRIVTTADHSHWSNGVRRVRRVTGLDHGMKMGYVTGWETTRDDEGWKLICIFCIMMLSSVIVVQCCTCFRKTLRKNTTMSGIGGWEESWVGFCWCFIASQDATTVSDSIRSVLFRIHVTCIYCLRYKMHGWYMGVLESSMINYSPGNPSSAGTSTRHSPLLIWMTVRFQGDPRGHSSDDYVRQIMQQHQCRMTPLATWQCLCSPAISRL